jgi:LacI family transcriptional regulator
VPNPCCARDPQNGPTSAPQGAGNVHYSDALAVPLTTIDQKTCQIGARAAELLLEQIGSKRPIRPGEILLVPELVSRKSTQRSGLQASAPHPA